jgi:hypothetical protein
MFACEHEIVEWQQRDQEMHVVGWACRWCVRELAADYHHETWCRTDFCGADPITSEEIPVRLSPERFRAELEQLVSRELARRSEDAPAAPTIHDGALVDERQRRLQVPMARRDVRQAGPTDQHAGAGANVELHAGSYPPAVGEATPAPARLLPAG